MSRYPQETYERDLTRLCDAMLELEQLRDVYGDLIAIPEIITIRDVMGIALDTSKGPQQVGDVCSRDEIIAILKAIEDNPCGDIALITQLALNDYRQTQTIHQE